MRRIIATISWIILAMIACSYGMAETIENKRIIEVGINANSFNPSINEQCELSYKLADDARVSVYAYDADFDLIKTFGENVAVKKGIQKVVWDGRDNAGKIVPDESYFFCIEAKFKDGTSEVYDPTTFSGGEEQEISDIAYDRENGFFNFTLKKPSRVLLRVGIKGGPLISTPIDWQPKPEGNSLAFWSGFDDDKVCNFLNHNALAVMATAFNLPDCSVITYGNSNYDYFTYKSGMKTSQKPRREEVFRTTKILPNYYYPREEDRAPRFTVDLINTKDGSVWDELKLQINADDNSKKYLLKNRFEVVVYLDGNFVFEEEEGYIPFNLTWKTKGIAPGEHYLTICLSSYLSQVASKTVKIRIE
jgi:hypothetical protein